MHPQRFPISVVLLGLLCFIGTNGVQGAKQLCQEAPNFEVVHNHLKTIESDFQAAKHEADAHIADKKKDGSPHLEELESETHNFVNNYEVMLQLMEQKPSLCERLITELEGLIKFFRNNTLKQPRFALSLTTQKP